jgi:hypothetical protein
VGAGPLGGVTPISPRHATCSTVQLNRLLPFIYYLCLRLSVGTEAQHAFKANAHSSLIHHTGTCTHGNAPIRMLVAPNGTSRSVATAEHCDVALVELPLHETGLGGGASATMPPGLACHAITRRADTEMESGGFEGSNGTCDARSAVRCSVSAAAGSSSFNSRA